MLKISQIERSAIKMQFKIMSTANADKSNAPIGGIYFRAGAKKGSVIDDSNLNTGFWNICGV